jgi:hypothetical protein
LSHSLSLMLGLRPSNQQTLAMPPQLKLLQQRHHPRLLWHKQTKSQGQH